MKRRTRSASARQSVTEIILAPPSFDEVIALLRAWRFWLLGGLIGAVLGAAVYAVAPPPYRARATVNVDFHLEQAWPEETDRQQFYYLERETRKLLEIANSDAVLGVVANAAPGFTVDELRREILHVSQPGTGGWHFYADSRDSERAALLADAWAEAFADEVRRAVVDGSSAGLERFITVDVVQSPSGALERTQNAGVSMLMGAGILLALGALVVLAVRFRR